MINFMSSFGPRGGRASATERARAMRQQGIPVNTGVTTAQPAYQEPVMQQPQVQAQPLAQPQMQQPSPAPAQGYQSTPANMQANAAAAQDWYANMQPHMRTPGESDFLSDYYNKNFRSYKRRGVVPGDYQLMTDRFGAARDWYDTQLKSGVDQSSLDDYYNQNFSGWMNTGTLNQPLPWQVG